MTSTGPFSREAYQVACITAIPEESAAFKQMLDRDHKRPTEIDSQDPNHYTFGEIGEHNVVLCCASRDGPVNMATTAADLRRSFPWIEFTLLVGIGGGVPSSTCDVRLGDVVVAAPGHVPSSGIIHHDHGKQLSDEFVQLGFPNAPPRKLLNVVGHLQSINVVNGSGIPGIITKVTDEIFAFKRPDNQSDLLFASDYEHASPGHPCDDCDTSRLVPRSSRKQLVPKIHYGVIASGSQLVRSAAKRDFLRDRYSIRCIEMEAAGILDTLNPLVIRGISDYADSHKNDRWKYYAALAAAAYAKELLLCVPTSNRASSPITLSVSARNPGGFVATQAGSSLALEAFLDKQACTIKATHWRDSIVDLLKVLGLKWDGDSRVRLAEILHVDTGPSGSARQNTALHRALMKELAVGDGEIVVYPEYLRQLRV
jgi:nucleoside phosphorylase